ncbi:MAG: hypothetical protein AUG51_00430 [Acidobacteria bacterium 13_1_20CM_3_53_8]|nr:MAG: hypothetical protein AUG51_00430 [Acidobacteria bacterium 13_1_20CM_3_53_8]
MLEFIKIEPIERGARSEFTTRLMRQRLTRSLPLRVARSGKILGENLRACLQRATGSPPKSSSEKSQSLF